MPPKHASVLALFVVGLVISGGCGGAARGPRDLGSTLSLQTTHGEVDDAITIEATSAATEGPVTITLLDGRRAPIVAMTRELTREEGSAVHPHARFVFSSYGVADPTIAALGVRAIRVSRAGVAIAEVDVNQYELEAGEPKRWDLRAVD